MQRHATNHMQTIFVRSKNSQQELRTFYSWYKNNLQMAQGGSVAQGIALRTRELDLYICSNPGRRILQMVSLQNF